MDSGSLSRCEEDREKKSGELLTELGRKYPDDQGSGGLVTVEHPHWKGRQRGQDSEDRSESCSRINSFSVVPREGNAVVGKNSECFCAKPYQNCRAANHFLSSERLPVIFPTTYLCRNSESSVKDHDASAENLTSCGTSPLVRAPLRASPDPHCLRSRGTYTLRALLTM